MIIVLLAPLLSYISTPKMENALQRVPQTGSPMLKSTSAEAVTLLASSAQTSLRTPVLPALVHYITYLRFQGACRIARLINLQNP